MSIAIGVKALNEIGFFVNKFTPKPEELLKVIQDKSYSDLKDQVRSQYQEALDNILKNNVYLVTEKVINDNSLILQAMGYKPDPTLIKDFQLEFYEQFIKKKYFDKTTTQRVNMIADTVSSDLASELRDAKGSPLITQKINNSIRKIKGHTEGFSGYRSSKRFVIGEINRASAEMQIHLADKIGVKKVKWKTQGDHLVSDMDRKRADKIYTTKQASTLQRHPFCRCFFQLVFPNDFELDEELESQ